MEDLGRNGLNCFLQNRLLQLAFPHDDDEPALGFQLPPDLLVPLLVAGNLGRPEIRVGLGDRIVFTILVSMPETAVDEDGRSIFWEDNVRRSRQSFVVHPITKSFSPKKMAKRYLRFA